MILLRLVVVPLLVLFLFFIQAYEAESKPFVYGEEDDDAAPIASIHEAFVESAAIR